MKLEEFKNNLEKLSREKLIEMIVDQWLGLAQFEETLKDALQCDKYNDHSSGNWQIEAGKLLRKRKKKKNNPS